MRRIVSFMLFCAMFATVTALAAETPSAAQEQVPGEGRAPSYDESIVEEKTTVNEGKKVEATPPAEEKAPVLEEEAAEAQPQPPVDTQIPVNEPSSGEEKAAMTEEPVTVETQPPQQESIFQEKDGILYYYGDLNYPVWSMGHRVGAVADLSSAYIVDENAKWRLIGFLSFPVVLRERAGMQAAIPLEEELRECWFWQKVKTGDFFFNRNGIPGNKVEGQAFMRELVAYQMLLEAAVMNMAQYGL